MAHKRHTRGGGTMIQLNSQISLADKLKVSLAESIAVSVELAGKRLIIVASYVPLV